MKVDRLIMAIVLTVGPFLSVILAYASIYGGVDAEYVALGVCATIFFWGFLVVAAVLLKYTEIKEGVRDARLSK